jgi:hypothetical protein
MLLLGTTQCKIVLREKWKAGTGLQMLASCSRLSNVGMGRIFASNVN